MAEEALEHFSKSYDEYTGCNDVLQSSSSDFQKSIFPVIEEMRKDMISIERYDWDYDTIYQYADEKGYLDPFYRAADAVCGKIIAVNEDLEAQRQYRQERKDNRARWEGGSFGGTVIDDYAHQASLGIRNAMEGVGHSVFNAVGNSVSKMAANSELKKIFSDPQTRTVIENGVFEAAFALHHVLIRLVAEAKEEIIWSVPSETGIVTAQRLINNLKSGVVPEDKANQIYQEILALNPYSLDLFEQMLVVFGDQNGELDTLADYYGIDLQSSKDHLAFQYVQSIQGETERDSVEAKEKLMEYCVGLGLPVTEQLECMKYINKRLEDFDLQYRTVDEVVCMTRDAADFAREELPKLQAFFGEITPPTSESLLDYEAALLEKKAEFEAQFGSELKQKYLEKIDGYLTDFDQKFCTTGLFKRVDRKQAGKDRLLKTMKKADTSSLEKIDEASKSMEELLPKLGLVQADTDEVFLAGEIPAIYDNGNESVIMFDQLPFDEQDWFSYTAGERIDLDNDGENEQIVNGPYGGIYFDARDGKVYVLAEGEGTTGLLSYTNYDNVTWIVHSDTTHMGRQTYWLTKYDGEGNIVDEFQLGAEYWDSLNDKYDENSDFTYRDKSISMEEYEALRKEIFGW